MPKYICERLIRHGDDNGKIRDFESGKRIELSEEAAKPLLDAGAIRAIGKKEEEEK